MLDLELSRCDARLPISIIIRTLPGRGALLDRALRSVFAQTYRPLEVIVVVDGGAESSWIPTSLNIPDLDIRYIALSKIGRSQAGNHGMAAARGALLNFLDDDDELLPTHASLLSQSLLDNPTYDAAYSASFVSFSDLVSIDPLLIEEHRRELFGRRRFDLAELWNFNQFAIQSVMFRKKLFSAHGGLCTNLDALEDWDLWLRFAVEKDFLYVDATTSRFRLPSSKQEQERRRMIHFRFLPLLRQRQAELLRRYAGTRYESRIRRAAL